MKNLIRRILILTVLIIILTGTISAQSSSSDLIEKTEVNSIEESYVIPQSSSGLSENDSGNESTAWLLIRMVLVLALICLIIWFAGKFIKKRMDPGAEPDFYLKKTAQLTLAPGRTIQIVTLRDRAYVLGVSESGISVIDKIDSHDDTDKSLDKELIDDMNLRAAENMNVKPQDFASMISSLTNSSKRTENFIKNRRLNFKKNGEEK